MIGYLILLLFIILIVFSVRSKILLNQKRRKDLPEIIASPVSQALTQILGTAGGIYLSLVMLAAFLEIQIPQKVLLFKWSIDPLAFFSLSITLLQPLILRVIQKI
ncbi:MAG: hypothetical protein GXW85_03120 [Clostridia bacterium]|nr:hypothetical protein [Clostridia bacterium]